jgi:predicted  nucleic acid-binding Zn-ribbon protein
VEQMCGRKKPKMLDKSLRGTNDLEVIIYNLKKEIDRLNEEVQANQIEITNLNKKIKEQIKSDN